jgi:F-type H+-transporting ATPase subunit b
MISLDGSVVAGIIIFLTVVLALNYILFRPLLRVQEERERRTTGTIAQAQQQLQHQAELFSRYEAAMKNARMEGYRLQEQVRSEALQKRKERLDLARKSADELLEQSRDSIRLQVHTAKDELAGEAAEIARSIAAAVLRRSA